MLKITGDIRKAMRHYFIPIRLPRMMNLDDAGEYEMWGYKNIHALHSAESANWFCTTVLNNSLVLFTPPKSTHTLCSSSSAVGNIP